MDASGREVSAAIDADIVGETDIELQIAVARLPGLEVDEHLEVTLDGTALEVDELASAHGGRIHRFTAHEGELAIRYEARIQGRAEASQEEPLDGSTYLRPSRYVDSDRLFGFAGGQFDLEREPVELAQDIARFVADRLEYVPGASAPTDGASDTLLAGAGVCRDYAHLVVALARAVQIPARLAAVYAPGCDPMDFHAVAEVLLDGRWTAIDATGLAPRASLVRIATGRDAADTAFLDNHGGTMTLRSSVVTAIVDGALPVDDIAELVPIR